MKDIGSRLRELRTNQGLTQEDLAKKVGIARTNYLKKEKGRENFKQEQISKLIKELSLTPEETIEIFFK